MRKLNKGRKLSRKIGPRKALLRSLANNFLLEERIKTTEAKAKEIKPVVEKMITRAKNASIYDRRVLSQNLTPLNVKKIITELAPRYIEKNGGYTRIIRLGPRNSDGAKMVILEFVR